VFVAFDVDERAYLKLRREAKDGKVPVAVGFLDDDAFPHPAVVDGADAAIDPTTGTVRLRATLANPKGEFLPGLSARVRLTPAK
jgi:multidrug efflux pump subunit AcrA (membrane-fusion protein)